MRLLILTLLLLCSSAYSQNERQIFDTMLRIESKIDMLGERINSNTSRLSSLETWKEQSDRYNGNSFDSIKDQVKGNSESISNLKEVVANMRGMVYSVLFIGGLLSFFINLGVSIYSIKMIRKEPANG